MPKPPYWLNERTALDSQTPIVGRVLESLALAFGRASLTASKIGTGLEWSATVGSTTVQSELPLNALRAAEIAHKG